MTLVSCQCDFAKLVSRFFEDVPVFFACFWVLWWFFDTLFRIEYLSQEAAVCSFIVWAWFEMTMLRRLTSSECERASALASESARGPLSAFESLFKELQVIYAISCSHSGSRLSLQLELLALYMLVCVSAPTCPSSDTFSWGSLSRTAQLQTDSPINWNILLLFS